MSIAFRIVSADALFHSALAEQVSAAGYEMSDQAPAAIVDADHAAPPGGNALGIGAAQADTGAYAWFLQKPVQLQALLRTLKAMRQDESRALAQGWRFHRAERLLRREEQSIALTEKEAELLDALLQAGEAGLSRQALLTRIWGYSEEAATHTLETHLYRLRAKLKEAGFREEFILATQEAYRIAP